MSETQNKVATKFTPGPWELNRHRPESQWFGNISGTYGRDERGIKNIRTISCQTKYGTDEECEANAALMIAAPEMFEALQGWKKLHADMIALGGDVKALTNEQIANFAVEQARLLNLTDAALSKGQP